MKETHFVLSVLESVDSELSDSCGHLFECNARFVVVVVEVMFRRRHSHVFGPHLRVFADVYEIPVSAGLVVEDQASDILFACTAGTVLFAVSDDHTNDFLVLAVVAITAVAVTQTIAITETRVLVSDANALRNGIEEGCPSIGSVLRGSEFWHFTDRNT